MEQVPSTAITEYEPITAALAGIEKYRGLIVDVTTAKGMQEAKGVHREVAALRIALDKTRKKVKESVLARGRLIESEANVIFDKIAAIENPIKAQIDAEDERVERERQAAIEAEQARLAAEERARKEAEEKKLADERAKIAAEREALEKARREHDEANRQALLRIQEEERAAKQRTAEAEDKARKVRQAEEDRLRAERDKIDAARREEEAKAAAERRAKEEAERKEREALDAKRREEDRKANELLDARGMLTTFRTRFGHLKPFAKVVKAIDALPAALKVAA